MSKATERLLQVGAVAAILYFGWSFLSGTVVYFINMGLQNSALQRTIDAQKQELAQCQQGKPPEPPAKK